MGDENPLLVLVADRNNALGEHSKLRGPIIGRDEARRAVATLGVGDPEDPLTNTIFRAIREYDLAIERGRTAELALLTGSTNVGIDSDRAITSQLDRVIKSTSALSCIFVTDGSDTEALLPLIRSRLVLERRFTTVVRQAPRLEGIWYSMKTMSENRRARPMVNFVGLVLIILGVALLTRLPGLIGIGLILLSMAILGKTYRWWDDFLQLNREALETVREMRSMVFFIIVAGFIIVYGLFWVFIANPPFPAEIGSPPLFFFLVYFMEVYLSFLAASVCILLFGRFLLDALMAKDPQRFLPVVPYLFQIAGGTLLVRFVLGVVLYFEPAGREMNSLPSLFSALGNPSPLVLSFGIGLLSDCPRRFCASCDRSGRG